MASSGEVVHVMTEVPLRSRPLVEEADIADAQVADSSQESVAAPRVPPASDPPATPPPHARDQNADCLPPEAPSTSIVVDETPVRPAALGQWVFSAMKAHCLPLLFALLNLILVLITLATLPSLVLGNLDTASSSMLALLVGDCVFRSAMCAFVALYVFETERGVARNPFANLAWYARMYAAWFAFGELFFIEGVGCAGTNPRLFAVGMMSAVVWNITALCFCVHVVVHLWRKAREVQRERRRWGVQMWKELPLYRTLEVELVHLGVFTHPTPATQRALASTMILSELSSLPTFIQEAPAGHGRCGVGDVEAGFGERGANAPSQCDMVELAELDVAMCAICIADFEPGEEGRRLACTHMFHVGCIDPWLLSGKRECPLCKKVGFNAANDAFTQT
ncbi:hypothetical protein HK101_011777 [Irineochytrium annulatum]|nr:hypothetical protein HK101_011777 [Irineochytrium annulatum]